MELVLLLVGGSLGGHVLVNIISIYKFLSKKVSEVREKINPVKSCGAAGKLDNLRLVMMVCCDTNQVVVSTGL